MSYVIVLRQFEKDDEKECIALLQKAARSLTNVMIKDSIFMKLLYLFVLSMALFNFGMSYNVILLLIIVHTVFIYVAIYFSVMKWVTGLKRNIWRNCLYKSDCKIWVAEALEPLCTKPDIKNEPYVIIPDYEYRHFEMSFRFISRKIIGIVGVCESSKIIHSDREANINMLYVHDLYAGKNIEEKLLNIATTYARNKQYFGINIQLTEYHKKMIQVCLQCGFILKRTYIQNIYVSLKTVEMYELTCHKMSGDNIDIDNIDIDKKNYINVFENY